MVTEFCIDVINSFTALKSSLHTACEHICNTDRDLPAWFQAPKSLPLTANSTIRQQACTLLKQLEYLDQQLPREILVGAGIIAASQTTIDALYDLNVAKNNFKQAILQLKAAKVATNYDLLATNFEQLLPQRSPDIAGNLSRMGLARLHLKQCYRKIPFFNLRPNKVSWTWANTRSIKKISIGEALELLNKHTQDAGIERQINLLRGLHPNEKLAIIQDLAPHLRANLVIPDGHATKRIMVKGPVPLFYLVKDDLTLPEFTPPGAKRGRDKDRMVRKDVKINPEPFLPAIRAHRYYQEEYS